MGGGGKSQRSQPLPEPEPIPERPKDPASRAVRDARALRLKTSTGHRGNIVTSPLGTNRSAVTGLGSIYRNLR